MTRVAAMAAMVAIIPHSKDPRPGRLDPFGALLSIVGLALLVYGIIRGGQLGGFTRPQSWAAILGGLAVLAAFVVYEARSDHPALDVTYFRSRRFSASVAAISLVFFALMGVTFFSVFYNQSVRGYSVLQSGLLVLPLAASQMFFAPRARLVVHCFGARTVCATGLVLTAVAFAGFLPTPSDRSAGPWGSLCWGRCSPPPIATASTVTWAYCPPTGTRQANRSRRPWPSLRGSDRPAGRWYSPRTTPTSMPCSPR